MIGQVNIYYRARPLLWADTTDTSYTNLDTSAQEAVLYYAVGSHLMNRGREDEWTRIWKPDYEAMITEPVLETIKMRTMPKSGRVRDMYNRGYPSSPPFLAGLGARLMAITRLGPMQRGTVEPLEFAIYGLGGGLNVKSVPQMVGDNDLIIAQDGYLTEDGGFAMRNGMTPFGVPFTSGALTHLARFFQEVKGGVVINPPLVELIAENLGFIYRVLPTQNQLIGNAGSGFQKPMTYARIQNPNDPHTPGGLTDCLVICTGHGGPYVYDGTNLYTPVGWASASGAQYCAVTNGILYFGGIPAFPNQTFGTGDGIIDSMETLPGYRNFIYSSPVVGLCASGTGATAALIVALNSGVAILSGTGPSNYYQQETPFADSCASGRTMFSWNGTIFFLGHSAEYAFSMNGVPTPISDKVEPWILNRVFTAIPSYPGFPLTQNRQLSWSCVYNNRLHIGYCSNAFTPNTVLVYDLVLQGWTVLRPTPGICSMILLDAPTDPDPYVAMVAGNNGQIYTWDVQPQAGKDALDDTAPILAQFQTKFYKIGVPGTNKALQRFYPELFASGDFIANFVVYTDYGAASAVINPLDIPYGGTGLMVWDESAWDTKPWGASSVQPFLAFTSPSTRIDYPGTQSEAFSFGVQMTQGLAPWIFAGGSGVFSQRGRT